MKNITAQLVRKEIHNNTILSNYLSRGIINITQLARELHPRIVKNNPKATVESISVAIQRLKLKENDISQNMKNILENLQITMRTGIDLYCLKKGGGADIRSFSSDDIFFVNQGVNEVTIIIDKKNKHLVKGKPVLEKKNLAMVSLRDNLANTKINYRITPGFVYLFLGNISKEGINVEDIISTHGQVSFIIEEKYLSRVYDICRNVQELRQI